MKKCWDEQNERWIYEGEETQFIFHNGTWTVRYSEEINICPDGIEMDVPVWREVEKPVVMEV